MKFPSFFKQLDWRSALSVMATLTSLSALYVSSRQLELASDEQQASVFPYLTMAYRTQEGKFGLRINNDGNGPAFVSGVEVRMRDSVYDNFWTPVQHFLDTLQQSPAPRAVKSDLLPGWVLRANADSYQLFEMENLSETSMTKFYQFYTDTKNGIQAKIWYLDLYNNCWLFDAQKNTVVRCEKCPNEVLHR